MAGVTGDPTVEQRRRCRTGLTNPRGGVLERYRLWISKSTHHRLSLENARTTLR